MVLTLSRARRREAGSLCVPRPWSDAETLMYCHGSCPGAGGQPAKAYTLPGQDNVLGSNIKHEAPPPPPPSSPACFTPLGLGCRSQDANLPLSMSSNFGEVA